MTATISSYRVSTSPKSMIKDQSVYLEGDILMCLGNIVAGTIRLEPLSNKTMLYLLRNEISSIRYSPTGGMRKSASCYMKACEFFQFV